MPGNYPERADVDHTLLLLQALAVHILEFKAAVELFDHAGSSRAAAAKEIMAALQNGSDPRDAIAAHERKVAWLRVAARDGAMTVYHFSESLKAFQYSLRRSTSLLAKVDQDKLHSAGKAFKAAFPKAKHFRHALAHSAEHKATRENFARHMSGGVYHESDLLERTFTVSRYREELSLDISDRTRSKLAEVFQTLCDCFSPALK